MNCRLQTELTNKEIFERTEHLNSKFKIKLQKGIKTLKKIPSFMMMGGAMKEGRIAVLEAMEASMIPLTVLHQEPHWVTFEVDDLFIKGLQDDMVVKALSKAKMLDVTREKMLKELMESYDATSGQWIEGEKQDGSV